jgi:anthranilate phosphoribosyltransferase
MDIKHVLKDHAYQNIPLNFEEAYELGVTTLESCGKNADRVTQFQSIAALCALHTRATYHWERDASRIRIHEHALPQSAAEQIAGICAAVFEHDLAKSEKGFLRPNAPCVIDNCGMGGDIIVTANISTISAFVASSLGVAMCKHGSPANADKGRHGSSDFIAGICGINNFAKKGAVEKCVEEVGFGYTEACDTGYKVIHIQTHEIAQLPHMNDIIGPITNPLDPKIATRKILGMNHLIPPKVAAEAYRILNQRGITNLEHGFFVRGFVTNDRYEGIDEVSICEGGTQVVELKDGEISEYYLSASDFGISPVPVDEIKPIGSKGEYSLKILQGEINGSRLKIVLANAALLLKLGGLSSDLVTCYKAAEEALGSGKAYGKMLAVRERLPIR